MAAKKGQKKQRRSTATRRKNVTYFSSGKSAGASSRKSNPNKRARRPRRSNPLNTTTVKEGGMLAISGMAIGFVQPMVRSAIARVMPSMSGPYVSAGITLLTAYGLGYLSKMLPFTRNFQRPLELSGVSIVSAQVISTLILPWANSTLSSLGSGASGLGRTRRRGMGDIVTLPPGNYDPYYGSTPRISAPAPAVVAAAEDSTNSKVATLRGLLTMPAMPGTSR